MVHPPQRITFVMQTVDALRRGLETREWLERLPPEQVLADQFQISRSTLRAAMQVLIEEGLLRTSKGRRAEIVAGRRAVRRADKHPVIGILSPYPLHLLNPYLELLRQHLQDLGFRAEFHVGARFYRGKPAKALESLTCESRVDCWVLLLSTAEMQRWFARRGIPAIVDGTCYEGVGLPALDVDYRTVCRHAVGMLLGLGHRRISLLIPKTGAGGAMRCEQGFQEGFQRHRSTDVKARVVHPKPSVEGLCAAVSSVLSAESPPSAVVVVRPTDVFTALTHLMNAGCGVPRDISLISLSDGPFLEHLIPSIARYAFTPEVYAKQLTKMISRLINNRGLLAEQHFILPTFQKGDSVGPCRNG